MTIRFESENVVIIYTLENIISYARSNQFIFVAQCVWWLPPIIRLDQGLIIHIDNLKRRSDIILREATPQAEDTINRTYKSH